MRLIANDRKLTCSIDVAIREGISLDPRVLRRLRPIVQADCTRMNPHHIGHKLSQYRNQ